MNDQSVQLAVIMKNIVELRRERLRRHFRREVNGQNDIIFVMGVFVSYGLVPIGVEPLTYCGHPNGKLGDAYPDRDAAHPYLIVRL
jgi:hypothetical protein